MALKWEDGGHALKSHGNYIVDHGKSWNCVLNFCGNPDIWCTLKDFKNAKIEITFDVSILLKFGKNEHQHVSKTCFKFYVKIINNVREIAIPYDSKVAI